MKLITKYQAFDGKEFTDKKEYEEYEDFTNRVSAAMKAWPKRPENDGCSFTNGGGFLKIDPEVFRSTRIALLELASEKQPHQWFDQSKESESIHSSYAGRIISEMPFPALYDAWSRIMNTDSENREWGQGYYTAHPTEAKQICLNK